MSWRVALALDTLLDEINERAPRRDKSADGSIGDAAHASRTSDHNPWVDDGVVTARDFTDDPDSGAAMAQLAEHLRRGRDPRIKYVIWNGRMFSSYPTSGHAAWSWRGYSGPNAHEHHLHLSVQPTRALYDSTRPWGWADATKETNMFVKQGDSGQAVRFWQRRLNRCVPEAKRIVPDGDYGRSTKALVALVTGLDGDEVGPVAADRIEQALLVRALDRATAGKVDINLRELAREVAEELTVTVKPKG